MWSLSVNLVLSDGIAGGASYTEFLMNLRPGRMLILGVGVIEDEIKKAKTDKEDLYIKF